MNTVFKENITRQRITNTKAVLSSLGIVIPFQPTMQDGSTILAVLNYTLETVQIKLEDDCDTVYANNLLARLKGIFGRLNFSTHRKSLAVILTPDEERVIYLNFPVKPEVICNKSVSLIDLVGNMYREPDFYLLLIQKNHAALYHCTGKHLIKAYEQNQKSGCGNNDNASHFCRQAFNIIELMNCNHEKPVFVTGNPEQADSFSQLHSSSQIIFKILPGSNSNKSEKIQSLSTDIIRQWDCWQSKFFAAKINLIQMTKYFSYGIEAVIQSLRKSTDGLLLIDKRFKILLSQSRFGNGHSHLPDEFMRQLEKFLDRGNCIEITASGLLKKYGDIVLLRNKASDASKWLSFCSQNKISGVDNLY
jgi:hypothetical protein